MATLVKGPIKLVTDRPDTVRKVNLRAPELRLHGAGIVTDHNDGFPVVDGVVEFPALPGPAVLTLVTAGGAPLRSVDIVVPDEETATLSECLDQIYTYDPPVVGRAQQFAREAGEHADRAEAGADRVGSAEQVGAWVGEAEVLRGATVEAANRAETQAGVATEQADLAGEHRQKAEDSAHAAAGAAAEATKTEIRAEMDSKVSEAEGSAQSAGESARVAGEAESAASGWAGQSKDAATLAITAAAALERHVADRDPTADDTAYKGAIWVAPSQVWIRGEDRWYPLSGAGGNPGNDGLTPRIEGGTWWIGDTDTGVPVTGPQGDDGDTPEIIDGTWWISGTSTGVPATGPQGNDGLTPRIVDGVWWIGDQSTGVPATGGGDTGEAPPRTPRILVYSGTDTPGLADFPDAQVGDLIERIADGQRWKVEES